MKSELLIYTSIFSLMVGMSGSLLGMEPDEKVQTLPRTAVAASSDPSSTEEWRAPFFQKRYSLLGPSLNLEALRKEIITISLNHKKLAENQEHLLRIERIKGLLNDDSDKEDETVHEFLYRLYSGAIMKTSPFNNPQKASELLERAYEQEEMWSFWAKASLAPKGKLTRDHYLAANRGHKEAIADVKAHTPYTPKIAKEFCEKLNNENAKFQTKITINEFKEKWQSVGYAKPFLDVLGLIQKTLLNKTIVSLINDSFLEIAANLGDRDSMYNLGGLKYQQKKPEEAETCYRKAANLGHVVAMYNLGCMLRNRNPAEAEKWYRKAADLGHVEASYNLGVLLEKQNKLEEAETCYRNAENLGHSSAMNNLGRLKYKQNKLEEAETLFRKAENLGHVEAMNNLGSLKYKQNKLEEVEAWYRKAADLRHVEAMYNLAILLEKQNRLEEAEKWYSEAGYVEAAYNVGVLLEKQNKLEKAEICYRNAAARGHVNAMYKLGVLKYKQNKLKEAETWYRKAENLGHVGAMYNLGVLKQQQNKLEEAEAWYRKAENLGHVGAMYNLGDMLRQQNKLEEAETCYRNAENLGHPSAMNNLGSLKYKQNKLEEAETCYRKAENLGHVEAMYNLGVLNHKQNKLEEAEAWYSKAENLGHVVAIYNLGVLKHQQNKLEEAGTCYRKAALKGHAPSMVQLGMFYLYRKEYADAIFWFEKAAALGNQYAQKLLEISQKSVQPLALSNDEVLSLSPEAPATMNVPEDTKIDSELNEVFEKIENPELQTTSNVQMSEQKGPLSEAPEGDERSSSSEDELDEGPMQAPEITVAPDIAPDVQPQVINNPKSRREQARILGLELRHIAEEAQKPNRQLSKPSQGIANDILSGDNDHITQADLKALFKDPYFAGQVIVEPTKSGFTVLSHHREKKLHLNAGAHRKHGQEKYTGHIHPNTLKGIKEILNVFDVEKK